MTTFPKQPNFILFMTDQQRSQPAYSKAWMQKNMPNYWHFLKHGVVFSNNICNSTPCGPSRASIFSGMYPANNGVTDNNGTITPAQMNFANVLNSAGYEVHYMGKLHLRDDFTSFSNEWPQNLESAAMTALDQNALLKNYYGMYSWTSPDFGTSIIQGNNLNQSQLCNLAGGTYGNDQRVVDGTGNLNENAPTVKTVIQHLEEKSKSGKPFCLVISLLNPHDISLFPEGWQQAGYPADLWDTPLLSEIGLPPSYQDDLSTKPCVQAAYLNSFFHGKLNEEQATQYVQFYAYLHTLSDKLLDDVMGGLSKDLLRDTVLLRLSDHGEMAMAHGGLQEKNCTMYNETIRVPMIWLHPAFSKGPRTQMVSLIDLVPTLGSLAGADLTRFPELQGSDFSAALFDTNATFSPYSIFNYTYSPPPPATPPNPAANPLTAITKLNSTVPPGMTTANYPNNIYAVVSEQHKFGIYFSLDRNSYVNWPSAQFELYDLSTDKEEMNNLITVSCSVPQLPTSYLPQDLYEIIKGYEILTAELESRGVILPLGWKAFYTYFKGEAGVQATPKS